MDRTGPEAEALKAATEGNAEKLEGLLDSSESLIESKYAEAEGRTLLHAAARYGKANVVQLLLARNADIWATTPTLQLPIHDAAWMGHRECVRLLVEHHRALPESERKGDYVNATNDELKTSLRLAAYNGHTEVGRYLIAQGADIMKRDNRQQSPLGTAVFSRATRTEGHPTFVRLLCESARAAGLNMDLLLNARDDEDSTPVHLAANRNHSEVLRILLEFGADVNPAAHSLAGRGNTPLHLAARQGATEAALLLLEAGANVNALNDIGQSPLDMAITPLSYWHSSVINRLEARGGRLGFVDYQLRLLPSETPSDDFAQALELAASENWAAALAIFERLLEQEQIDPTQSFVTNWNAGQCGVRLAGVQRPPILQPDTEVPEMTADKRALLETAGTRFSTCCRLADEALSVVEQEARTTPASSNLNQKLCRAGRRFFEAVEKEQQVQYLLGLENDSKTEHIITVLNSLVSGLPFAFVGATDVLLERFPLNDTLDVYVFERLPLDTQQDPTLMLFYKTMYKVVDRKTGGIVEQVNVEQSAMTMPDYVLGLNDKTGRHSTLPYQVGAEQKYQAIKTLVARFLLQDPTQFSTRSQPHNNGVNIEL